MIDSSGKDISIRHAQKKDLKGIIEIAKACEANKKDGKIISPGLISAYSSDDYLIFIENSSLFFVLETEGELSSFLLAFSSDDPVDDVKGISEVKKIISYHEQIHELSLKDTHKDTPSNKNNVGFIVVKQIATAKKYQKNWHARYLYRYLKILQRSTPIYAAIVVKPVNKSSIRLHEDAGFIRRFEFTPSDGELREFWRCSRIENSNLLIHQHKVAESLYRHEDELNWKKLSASFYISGVLVAGIVGIFFRSSLSGTKSLELHLIILACIIAILGLFTSYFFCVALKSGVKYMLQRKQSLIDIDCEISKLNGIRMFVPVTISPTAKFLKIVPTFVTVFWVLVLLILIWTGISQPFPI